MLSYEKILVPVDFTEVSSSALVKAARHSAVSGSRLFATHIVDPNPVLTEGARQSVKRDAIQQLENLLDDSEVGYCEKIVEFGETVSTLVKIINEYSIDLVVMGTQHFNTLDEDISVTRVLGGKIECDILILHK